MARREYDIAKGIEGLVFFAPLSVEGDLTDHISGNSPTIPANMVLSWDATYQGYRIRPKTYASSQGGNRYTTGLIYGMDYTPIDESMELTALYECVQYRATVYSGSVAIATTQLIKSDSNTSMLTIPNSGWPRAEATKLNTKMYVATSLIRRSEGTYTTKYYLNGGNLKESSGTWTPQVFGTARYLVGNQQDGRSSYYNDAVLRNVMIFDRVLTLDEIKQIQGL